MIGQNMVKSEMIGYTYKKMSRQLVIIAVLMLIGMTIYEMIKQFMSPDITIWQSHVVTIVVSTFSATAVSFFILKKHILLSKEVIKKKNESDELRKELEATVKDLEDAIAQVRTLSGLLPICSSCKKIRDDKGYWTQIESYIYEHSDAEFSHGICPDCAKDLYGDLYDEVTMGRDASYTD
jgi:hypothetical protein